MKKINRMLATLLSVALILFLTGIMVFAEADTAEAYYNYLVQTYAKDGKFHLNCTEPADDEVAYCFLNIEFDKYSNDEYEVSGGPDYLTGKPLMHIQGRENEENNYDHIVDVAYATPDATKKAKLDAYKTTLDHKTIKMYDMDVVNLLYNSKGNIKDNLVINYASELKEILNNGNISAGFSAGAGSDPNMAHLAMGGMALGLDGISYTACEGVTFAAANIIYIPSSTADTTGDYAAAAKARIENYIKETASVEYLGTADQVKASLAGDDLGSFEASQEELLLSYDPDLSFEDIYNVTFGGKTYMFLILKDDNKMLDGSLTTADISTGAMISTTSANVPKDSMIEFNSLDMQSAEAKDLLKTFGISDGYAFDVSLRSFSSGSYVEKLANGEFKVFVPVKNDITGTDLVAYYEDAQGNIEEHAATMEKLSGVDYYVFFTNHFSTYTIGAATAKAPTEKVADTADMNDSAACAVLGAVSVIGLAYIYKKRK